MASNGTQVSDANQNPAPQSDKPVPQNVANVSGGNRGRGRGSLGRGSHGGVSQNSVNNVPNLPRSVPNLPTTSWTNRDYSRAEGRRRNLERTITFTAEDRNEPAPKQAIEDVSDEASDKACPDCKGHTCGFCRAKDHAMIHCLMAKDGNIPGCVMWNTMAHELNACPIYMGLDMQERLKGLINERAGLPNVKVKDHWSTLFHAWLYDKASEGMRAPDEYPWTEAHAIELNGRQNGNYAHELQLVFEKSGHDRSVLPKDEVVKDAVGVWWHFWLRRGLPFPQRLVEMGFTSPFDTAGPKFGAKEV